MTSRQAGKAVVVGVAGRDPSGVNTGEYELGVWQTVWSMGMAWDSSVCRVFEDFLRNPWAVSVSCLMFGCRLGGSFRRASCRVATYTFSISALAPSGSLTGRILGMKARRAIAVVAATGLMLAGTAAGAIASLGGEVRPAVGPDSGGTEVVGQIPNLTFKGLSAGDTHVLATETDGKTYAWGLNNGGQLGDGSAEPQSSPVAV